MRVGEKKKKEVGKKEENLGKKRKELTFFNPTQSDSAMRKVATSMRTTPGVASTRLEAPYPLTWAFASSILRAAEASASGSSSWGSGLWQCQKSIISAQFPLGRSFQIHPVVSFASFSLVLSELEAFKKGIPHARHRMRVDGDMSAAVQGT